MKYIFVLLFTWVISFSLFAQTENDFLFDEFQKGIVYYRDGRIFDVPLNYNLVTNQFLFIDKKDDNLKKEFAEPEMIISIKVGDRTFLSPSEGATEIIQVEPMFYVSYEGVVKKEKEISYGGTTQTASVDSYTQIRGVGRIGGADGTKRSLAAINYVYKVRIGKKIKRFSTEKQFLKLFPNQAERLSNYIKEKEIDFNNINQVFEIYNFACMF